jgi:MscS family membrane protein
MIADWLRQFLPAAFFKIGPKGLMWWQWLGLIGLMLLALAIGRAMGALTRRILRRLTHRTAGKWDDLLFARISGGIGLLWAVAVFHTLLSGLELPKEAHDWVRGAQGAVVVVITFWMIWRAVDVLIEVMAERPWAAGNPSARSLLSVGGNFVRIAVLLAGVVATLAVLGYPVATLVAGLGIGGIAIAFGAQKTVENLFGSVALAADRACRVGDTIKVGDVTGTVERIGARSTLIRTLDRTLVTIPNGKLSDDRIENFAVRERIKFQTIVRLPYDTTEAQLTRIVTGMEKVLRGHPKIWSELVLVRFIGFGQTALEVEVLCWFETTDYDHFRDYRQDVLLGFMRVVEGAGTTFAGPAPVQMIDRRPTAGGGASPS